jgi:hypothetical protein
MMRIMHAIKRRLARHKQLLKQYKDPHTIFIYQMGKVGSTSLELGINNALHVHAFYHKNHICPVRLQGLAKFGLMHIVYRAEQEVMAYLIRRAFWQRKQSKIITLVRDPMARNMSMFFHDLDAYLFSAHTNCMNTRDKALPTRFQDMDLLNKVFEQEFDHYYPLNWFQNEFLPMTGINIFDYPFDANKGQLTIKQAGFEVLCLRSDKIKHNVDLISQFVGQEFELSKANDAKAKWYAELYCNFTQHYQAPSAIQQALKDSQLYQHFFTKN